MYIKTTLYIYSKHHSVPHLVLQRRSGCLCWPPDVRQHVNVRIFWHVLVHDAIRPKVDRKKPPPGGVSYLIVPDQEPGGRGPPLKHLDRKKPPPGGFPT